MTLVWESGITLQHPDNNDPLLDLNTQPSLDLQFASNKSLLDNISGFPLVNHQRDASSGKSAGTYVDSDGLIKTTPVNYKINSEEVDTFLLTQVTVAANQFAAPNGTLTADRVDITTANSSHQLTVGTSVLGAISSTTSVYVKGISNVTQVQLRASISGGRASAVYDLVNVTSEAFRANNVIFADSSITPAGNDWYRISLTFTTSGANASGVFLNFTDGNADPGDDRNGQQFVGTNESIAVWGAQVEKGLVMNDYIPTGATISGAPRFDHDPVTGESLGLLIEEERINLMLNSGTTDEMVATSGVVRTSGGFAAPDESTEASRVDVPAVTGPNEIKIITETFSGLQTNTDYTASIYLKGINGGELVYLTFESGVPTSFVAANLTTEWQRFDITGTTTNGTLFFNVGVDTRGGTGQANQPAQSFYAWGAQVEKGSFPTSYIPTDATPGGITRAADVASIEGTNFSSWYNQSEGTVFVAVDKAYKTNTIAASFNDGSDDNRVEVRSSGGSLGNARYVILDNSTTVYNKESSTAGANRLKLALAYKTGSVNNAINGVIDIVDATASIPNVSRLAFQNEFFLTDQRPGHIARLAYYPYRLTDTTLQEITS